MTFDALLKRFFPAIVLMLIAIAAYFQASGITELVAGAFLGAPEAKPATKAAAHGATGGAADTRGPKSAEPILSRNPFDSVTGPLNKVATEGPEGAPETPQQADLSNPLTAPDCGGI